MLRQQLLDDGGVDRGASRADDLDAGEEVGDMAHTGFQKVAHAARPVGDERGEIRAGDELGEDEDRQSRMLLAQFDRGLHPIGRGVRRHAHVGDHQGGRIRFGERTAD
ncbi:hypothetical protein ABE10_01655, partial [Bacillus toyonensis]|nr:hypothetical protein [Bacillus toyonensis]